MRLRNKLIIFLSIIIYFQGMTPIYAAGFFILGIISYFRGVRYMEASWESMFPKQIWWIVLMFYLVGFFFYSRVIMLKEYLSYVIVAGFLQVLISLIILNFRQLGDATLTRDKKPFIPTSIKRHNWLLIFFNLLIITFIAAFNNIKEFTIKAFKKIAIWILIIIDAIHSLMDRGESGGGPMQGGMEDFPFADDTPPPNPILDLIFNIFAGILVTIGLIFLIYFLYKGIRKLIAKIAKWFKEILKERELYEESYGYIDEKENLIDLNEMRDRYAKRVRSWIESILERQPRWRDLKSNRERVRYLYKMTILKNLKRGYSYRAYMTPKEIEKDIMNWQNEEKEHILNYIIPVYNRARYGKGPIDDSETERLYKLYREN